MNWYIVDLPDGVILIDAGVPGHKGQLDRWLAERSGSLAQVKAVLLTHGHPDHVGFSEQLRRSGVPVWVHSDDAALAGGQGLHVPPRRFRRNLWRPYAMQTMAELARGGLLTESAVRSPCTFGADDELPVPGAPHVIGLPGHTPGTVAFYFAGLDALFTGDALVTLDPITGHTGPFANADNCVGSEQRLRALDPLADLHAASLYPGHGAPSPSHGGVGAALDAVRRAATAGC